MKLKNNSILNCNNFINTYHFGSEDCRLRKLGRNVTEKFLNLLIFVYLCRRSISTMIIIWLQQWKIKISRSSFEDFQNKHKFKPWTSTDSKAHTIRTRGLPHSSQIWCYHPVASNCKSCDLNNAYTFRQFSIVKIKNGWVMSECIESGVKECEFRFRGFNKAKKSPVWMSRKLVLSLGKF